MSSIDYGTIALITIFTSFFSGIGHELAKEIIQWIRKGRNKIKGINGKGVLDKP
jgi:Trk-type K+ transport system membrane component